MNAPDASTKTSIEISIEKFLKRWSRRKRWAEQHDGAAAAPPPSADAAAVPDTAVPEFDPASLPPIETINAASDVRAFLARGVPAELTRAALRRAWATDPAIHDFIEIAENQWDFNRPDGVPGFGSSALTPELLQLMSEFCGDSAVAEDEQRGSIQPARLEQTTEMPSAEAVVAPSDDMQATKSTLESGHKMIVRKHGEALPFR